MSTELVYRRQPRNIDFYFFDLDVQLNSFRISDFLLHFAAKHVVQFPFVRKQIFCKSTKSALQWKVAILFRLCLLVRCIVGLKIFLRSQNIVFTTAKVTAVLFICRFRRTKFIPVLYRKPLGVGFCSLKTSFLWTNSPPCLTPRQTYVSAVLELQV